MGQQTVDPQVLQGLGELKAFAKTFRRMLAAADALERISGESFQTERAVQEAQKRLADLNRQEQEAKDRHAVLDEESRQRLAKAESELKEKQGQAEQATQNANAKANQILADARRQAEREKADADRAKGQVEADTERARQVLAGLRRDAAAEQKKLEEYEGKIAELRKKIA